MLRIFEFFKLKKEQVNKIKSVKFKAYLTINDKHKDLPSPDLNEFSVIGYD